MLLVVLSQGGWEIDESIEDAALRETLEEAGVVGDVEVGSSPKHNSFYNRNLIDENACFCVS